MSTITTMTDDSSSPTAAVAETAPDANAPTPGRHTQTTPPITARTLSIPLPTAIVGALITAMFGLLFFSLNGLRSDIDSLRSDTNSQITELRNNTNGQIAMLRSDMDQRFAEMHAILLDHTDRLARIETHLDLNRDPDTANP